MQKKTIIIVALIVLIVLVVLAFLLFRQRSLPQVVTDTQATKVVNQTISSLNPDSPQSLQNIQSVVDLGDRAVQPLLGMSESDDLLTQWTVVVGLSSVRRDLTDQSEISAQMQEYYQSKFSAIRLHAASSNVEFGDYSGVQILITALESDAIMTFMEPPKPESHWANLTLEYASGLDFGFDEAASATEKRTSINSWKNWAAGLN